MENEMEDLRSQVEMAIKNINNTANPKENGRRQLPSRTEILSWTTHQKMKDAIEKDMEDQTADGEECIYVTLKITKKCMQRKRSKEKKLSNSSCRSNEEFYEEDLDINDYEDCRKSGIRKKSNLINQKNSAKAIQRKISNERKPSSNYNKVDEDFSEEDVDINDYDESPKHEGKKTSTSKNTKQNKERNNNQKYSFGPRELPLSKVPNRPVSPSSTATWDTGPNWIRSAPASPTKTRSGRRRAGQTIKEGKRVESARGGVRRVRSRHSISQERVWLFGKQQSHNKQASQKFDISDEEDQDENGRKSSNSMYYHHRPISRANSVDLKPGLSRTASIEAVQRAL